MKSLFLSALLVPVVCLTAHTFRSVRIDQTAEQGLITTTLNSDLAANSCGVSYRNFIDPSDGFWKVYVKNTCPEPTRFTIAVYATDGSVNRSRRYCYQAGQAETVTIGKGDWIAKVVIEDVEDC